MYATTGYIDDYFGGTYFGGTCDNTPDRDSVTSTATTTICGRIYPTEIYHNAYYTTRRSWVFPAWSFRKPLPEMVWPGIEAAYNHAVLVMIKNITNVFAAAFFRKAGFSKSGFIGRTAKRKKGKL